MNNYLIGMHGRFDESKYKRDFRPGFFGVEVCMFKDESEVEKLVQKAKEDCFNFGVHYPLIKKDTLYRDPFFLSTDAEERQKAFDSFENETAYAAEKGAAYILTHFPKPVLVNKSLDLQYWRFAGDKEWMFADTYPLELLKDNLNSMFEKLSDISDKYSIQIVLENDAMPTLLCEDRLLPGLLDKYSNIKLCLDIGRLHLQEILDSSFKSLEFAEAMAPYTYSIHLWNTNPNQNLFGGHYPVLPGQKPSEGWANVESFIKIIKKYSPQVKVLFEHRSDLVSDEELDESYKWVKELLIGYDL